MLDPHVESPRRIALATLAAVAVATVFALLSRAVAPAADGERAARARRPPFAVPEFALRDQHGALVTNASLRGHPWVADFIYIECGEVCPILTRRMLALRSSAAPASGIRFVSFSVAPADGPAALARYAGRVDRSGDSRWQLLAADDDWFPRLAVGMGVADSAADVRDGALPTSRLLFLIDADGIVRGVYDGLRDGDVARLSLSLGVTPGARAAE